MMPQREAEIRDIAEHFGDKAPALVEVLWELDAERGAHRETLRARDNHMLRADRAEAELARLRLEIGDAITMLEPHEDVNDYPDGGPGVTPNHAMAANNILRAILEDKP